MRIAVTHWSSADNVGDLAIISAQFALLEEQGHEFAVVGAEPSVSFPGDWNYITSVSPWGSPGEVGLLKWAGGLLQALVCLVQPNSRLAGHEFRQFSALVRAVDVVMPKGGGYLYARPGIRPFLFVLRTCYPLLLARRIGRRRVLWGHSVGPADGAVASRVLRSALVGADVVVRDAASSVLLAKWGLRHRRAPDLALKHANAVRPRRTRDGVVIGVTARVVGRGHQQVAYEDSLVDAVRRLVGHIEADSLSPVRVVLCPQVIGPTAIEDDRIVLRRLASRLGPDASVVAFPANDFTAVMAAYGTLDLLIATRLHSAILAACVQTPFVVLEYIGGKARGVVEDLGLPPYVCIDDYADTAANVLRAWHERRELSLEIWRGTERARAHLATLSLSNPLNS